MKNFKAFNASKEVSEFDDQLVESIMDLLLIREANTQDLYEAFDLDQDTLINEGIMDVLKMDVKDVAKNLDGLLKKGLGKTGLHLHKGKGLISYIMSAGKGVGKIMLALLKGDKETVKELSQSVRKEDVVDFVLKLDQATMHVITGPIHMLDAITGWHIGANLDHVMKGKDAIIAKIKSAIGTIRTSISGIMDKGRELLFNKGMDKLEAEIT